MLEEYVVVGCAVQLMLMILTLGFLGLSQQTARIDRLTLGMVL